MTNLPEKNIYLAGIGGTGMAALANLLVQKKFNVSGSDRQFYPPMGDFLNTLPIKLYSGFSAQNIKDVKPDTVIIGNALSRGNPEVEYVLENKIPYFSMAGALNKFFMNKTENIVVTGTHGKTTTTSLIANLFNNSPSKSSFLIGGIPLNFNIPSKFCQSKYFVIEGDEYDSAFFEKFPKFLKYAPKFLIINNIEFDHADIYSSLAEIKKQFKYLLRLVPANGLIIANGDNKNVREVCEEAFSKIIYYGQKKENDFCFTIQKAEQSFAVIIKHKKETINIPVTFPFEGLGYNITAAYIAGKIAHINQSLILKSFKNFKGVKRRLEKIFENENYVVYDDFAHHPTAVKTTLEAVKKQFPQKHLVAIFEPRSNTSIRNIFLEEYKESLLKADTIFLAPAFNKKANQDDKLNVKEITNFLNKQGKKAFTEKNHELLLKKCIKNIVGNSVIIIMSNGSFEPFKNSFIQFLKGAK